MTAVEIAVGVAAGWYVGGVTHRAYYRWQARRTAAELERRVMADAARILDAFDAQIAVEKIARILDNAGAIHPVRVRTWDGRYWRIDDGEITEIGAPE